MVSSELPLPQLALLAGTRGLLGAGGGLLLADRVGADQRRAVGWAPVAMDTATTIALALMVFNHRKRLSD